MCVCVYVCLRACERACARARARAYVSMRGACVCLSVYFFPRREGRGEGGRGDGVRRDGRGWGRETERQEMSVNMIMNSPQ